MPDNLKIFSHDDPDPQAAGQGLAFAPMVHDLLGQTDLNYWMMSPAEQMAMVYLLEHRRPQVAIEIGTRFGGSLQVLAGLCQRVYSLDIDAEVPERMAGKHTNVEYIIGPSGETLPPLLEKLAAEDAPLGFILVDGDHSAAGVQADIDCILQYRPIAPLYVVMHDSFNPQCRRGLLAAGWTSCPYAHAVELDLVAGVVNPSPQYRDQLWGGLALGILLPEKRQGELEITGRAQRTFDLTSRESLGRSLGRRLQRRAHRRRHGHS